MKKILSAMIAVAAVMSVGTYSFAEDIDNSAEDNAVLLNDEENGENGSEESALVSVTAKYTVSSDTAVEDVASNDALLVKDGVRYAWSDVKSVTFSSEKEFSLEFEIADEDGKNVLGEDVSNEVDIESLNLDASKTYKSKLKLTAEETVEVEVAVVMKDGAKGVSDESEPVSSVEESSEESKAESVASESDSVSSVENTNNDNENTGVALAVAPAGLAVAFVAVAAIVSKKKQ